jgi:hypothetical protein
MLQIYHQNDRQILINPMVPKKTTRVYATFSVTPPQTSPTAPESRIALPHPAASDAWRRRKSLSTAAYLQKKKKKHKIPKKHKNLV